MPCTSTPGVRAPGASPPAFGPAALVAVGCALAGVPAVAFGGAGGVGVAAAALATAA